MWESSLFEDKLAGDLGNVIEATSIRRSSVRFFTAGKLASGNLRLFQQHRPVADIRDSGLLLRKLTTEPHFAGRKFLI
jgi:hypothetical protein